MASDYEQPQYTCSICKQQVSSEHIRYNAELRTVCAECLKKIGTVAPVQKQKKELRQKAADVEEQAIKVICSSCRYKFTLKPHFRPSCPYCGGSRLQRYDSLTAEGILAQVSSGM